MLARPVRIALLCSLLWVAAAAVAPAAEAARVAAKPERGALLRAAAASAGGKSVGLLARPNGRATVAPFGYRTRAAVLAVRSSIARSWALLVVAPNGRPDLRQTFLLQRRLGRWRVWFSASRGSEPDKLCGRSRPGTAIALDLGLSSSTWSGKCRHPRRRSGLIRPMTAAELASVRAMVEWTLDDSFNWVPGPVQPRASEVVTSDCAWDGRGQAVPPPYGEVARSNPRWGVAVVYCVIGSDGFGLLESPTLILVRRGGRTGPFTAVPAHTLPSWSVRGELCWSRRWPVPAAPRVALEFCTPFPAALSSALR